MAFLLLGQLEYPMCNAPLESLCIQLAKKIASFGRLTLN